MVFAPGGVTLHIPGLSAPAICKSGYFISFGHIILVDIHVAHDIQARKFRQFSDDSSINYTEIQLPQICYILLILRSPQSFTVSCI